MWRKRPLCGFWGDSGSFSSHLRAECPTVSCCNAGTNTFRLGHQPAPSGHFPLSGTRSDWQSKLRAPLAAVTGNPGVSAPCNGKDPRFVPAASPPGAAVLCTRSVWGPGENGFRGEQPLCWADGKGRTVPKMLSSVSSGKRSAQQASGAL